MRCNYFEWEGHRGISPSFCRYTQMSLFRRPYKSREVDSDVGRSFDFTERKITSVGLFTETIQCSASGKQNLVRELIKNVNIQVEIQE